MTTLHTYLTQRAASTPHLEAIVAADQRFTYMEFNNRVNQVAAYMLAAGATKGDHIGILCKNNHPYPTILLAALKIGAVAIPLNWRLTAYEMQGIMKIAQPKLLFYDEEFADTLSLLRGIKFVPVSEGLVLSPEFASIFSTYSTAEPASAPISDQDLAFILFTSGTTGIPKGCMIAHECYDLYIRQQQSHPRVEAGLRFLAVHPMFHMSSTSLIFFHILRGNTMVFLAAPSTAAILDMIAKEKIQTMFAFPSVYAHLWEEIRQEGRDVSSLLFVSAGGTKVPATLIRRYLKMGIPMGTGYGSTEAAFVSHWNPSMGIDTAESAGTLMPQVQVKIVDPQTGQELPTGEVGEIIVKSPYLFKGYLNNPEATAQTIRDGWIHMGDAGKLDENGFLYVSGRFKEMILFGGDNIYPTELEEVIHKIPGVLEVAVIGVPHEEMGEAPLACVIKHPASRLTEEDILKECRERLAAYKIPSVVFVGHLPKNGVGKVLKAVLKEQFAGDKTPSAVKKLGAKLTSKP
ncbi:class I adenylate-forming enzyme family protein [Brevibacillus fluminis]|uniref:class I adenylate-forming enzyme family protein n=1 Tax=Brevibacillus fluminis TaxID=511487 RepID=UPI003F8B0474